MKVGVLASGAGTNLQAILDRVHGREGVVGVGGGPYSGGGAGTAPPATAGVPSAVFPLDAHTDRADRDTAMAAFLESHGVELVVLAGYMALLTPAFLARFPQRVINVHPALLPAFPGVRAIEQALEYGVKVFGVTVHFVDAGVDTGPVIAQRAVELPDATGVGEVREALRPLEHALLCDAVVQIARGAVRFDPERPRRVTVGR